MIRALDERGHLIGAHSHTHPTRMSACTYDELMREWRMSTGILRDILGRRITVASVPGGYYSRDVARAAAACGIRTLFTSEPTTRIRFVDGCRVIGRFVLLQGSTPEIARDLAAGRVAPRLSQAAVWGIKKVVKRIGARPYLWVRQSILTRASTRAARHH
jgi:peptidoglycan/xylan/chitin deacetylase (PgdA/CDA1 family)